MSEARRIVEALYAVADTGRLEDVETFFSPDFIDHNANSSRSTGDTDRNRMIAAFREFQAGFPDTRHTLHDVIAEGDRVALRVSAEGTHTGTAFGHAATGGRFRNDSIVIYRIEDGRIAEKWSRESRGVLDQLSGPRDPGADKP